MSEKIPFNIGPNVILSYKRLDYKIWYALAEFIDNSTQSYISNRKVLEKAHAVESTEALKHIILDENPEGVFYIHSKKIDSFGRCLATVILKSGLEVNTELVDLGYASKWKI